MEYTTLGKTGLRISRMGFGGIPIQRIDEAGTCKLFRKLAENGINYIDTARAYTVSECFIGAAISGMRENFVLATKARVNSKAEMAKDIDISLSNLRTDYIDLYQLHNPSMAQLLAAVAPGGALEALQEAKAAGKIRHIGLTCHALEVFEKALEYDWVETIMFPYNIVETQGKELMAKCAEKNIGFVCMKPLAGGAIENGRLAMRYVCADPNVTVVIPGMADEAELEENIAAVCDTSALTEEELQEMEAVRKQLGTQFCRRCNYCAPCSVGISIPNVFLFEGYLSRYGLDGWARERYATLDKVASDCIQCGACEARCPYGLPIREMLKKAAKGFGK